MSNDHRAHHHDDDEDHASRGHGHDDGQARWHAGDWRGEDRHEGRDEGRHDGSGEQRWQHGDWAHDAEHTHQPAGPLGSEIGQESPPAQSSDMGGWHQPGGGSANGLDALLFDYLVQHSSGGHGGQSPIILIDHFDIFNTQQTNTSQVFLNAANGGSIDIGGSVNSLASQQGPVDHAPPHTDMHMA